MTLNSLNRRYFAKLTTNLVVFISSLLAFAIIPRSLGAKAYGDFSYLTNFFTQLFPFLTFGTSLAFFTKLSQRQNEFGLIIFYSIINLFATITLISFIFFSVFFNVEELFWPGQSEQIVWMSFFFSLLGWFIAQLTQVSDAYGITIKSEIARIVEKILGLVLVLFSILYFRLDLKNFYLCNYFSGLILIAIIIIILKNYLLKIEKQWNLEGEKFLEYTKEFYRYSRPVFIFSLLSVLVAIFDRWFLQKYAGSTEQGFYGISFQLSAVGIIFTSAMSPLIMREFSIEFNQNNFLKMGVLFDRYASMLFGISAFFCCFICVNSDRIILLFGGEEFKSAHLTMVVMSLYPMHQTYGQICSSVFFASSKTKFISKISLFSSLIGIPFLFLLIGPNYFFGLQLGSIGLAIKVVVIQFLSVNLTLYYVCKFLNLQYNKYIFHQLIAIATSLAIAFVSKWIFVHINFNLSNLLFDFLFLGIVYLIFSFFLAILNPYIWGFNKSDVSFMFRAIKK